MPVMLACLQDADLTSLAIGLTPVKHALNDVDKAMIRRDAIAVLHLLLLLRNVGVDRFCCMGCQREEFELAGSGKCGPMMVSTYDCSRPLLEALRSIGKSLPAPSAYDNASSRLPKW